MKIPEEFFSESDGVGTVSMLLGEFRYRFDDVSVRFTEWQDTEFSDVADVARALKKRHPGKTVFLPGHPASDDDDRDLDADSARFDELILEALRTLGVSNGDIRNVKVYEGSMGGDHRKTLRNAAFYGERYLVGKSLLQHHDPYRSVGTSYEMDALAEELVDTARSVIVSTRDGGNRGAALKIAVAGLSSAIDSAKERRS